MQKILAEARSVDADAASRMSAILGSFTGLEDREAGLRMAPCVSKFFDPIPS